MHETLFSPSLVFAEHIVFRLQLSRRPTREKQASRIPCS
jgi:hypothetical protein